MKQVFSGILTAFLALGLGAAVAAEEATIAKVDLKHLQELQGKVREVTAACLPATVAVLNGPGSGSGVVVSREGLILTAAHVIERAKEVQIVFADGREATGRVLGANFTRDIAMIKLLKPGPWPHIEMGESARLQRGEWVVALGHAKGYDPNRTPPVRFARLLQPSKRGFLLTDCTLIGGDSGGPLFNLEGELVGIHSSIGNNLSINNHAPIDAFEEDWDRLLAGKQWGQLGRHPLADPDSPVLGVAMELRRGGIGIGEVFPNSPASRAGLKAGDLLIAVEEARINDGAALLRELSKFEAGEKVRLTVKRAGREMIKVLTLRRRADVFPMP